MPDLQQQPAIIIGAGPAGLAIAGRLTMAGLPFRILEKASHVGERWHHHYDRLCLHTVKQRSSLPYLPFPEDYPRYVPRELLIRYFEEYATHFDLKVEFGMEVRSIRKDDTGSWLVKCDDQEIRARSVVLATGTNNFPRIPDWPGKANFSDRILHSKEYRNPTPFLGQKVLVIGMGNTGAEIALDLALSDIPVLLSVRGEVNIVPRDLNGRSVQETGKLLEKLPFGLGDHLGAVVQSLYFGNLRKYGLKRSGVPPAKQLKLTGKTPVVDIGTVKAIKAGKIRMMSGVKEFDRERVIFEDGASLDPDVVILATGYKSGLEKLVDRMEDFLDENGYPLSPIGHGYHKGLYFLGFNNYELGGILGTIYEDSQKIAVDLLTKKQFQ